MSEVLNLRSADGHKYGQGPEKKSKKGLLVTLIVIVLAVSLTTLGIRASDGIFGSLAGENSVCPDDMVYIPTSDGGFCIDKYEASAGSGCKFIEPINQDQTRLNIENSECRPESKPQAVPWRNISQDQAKVACAKAGKRLATGQEWMQAALGTPDKDSSWGDNDCQVDNNWEDQPGKTGQAGDCQSSFGAFDMVGNVWEWTEETVVDGKYLGIEAPESGYVKGFSAQAMPVDTDPSKGDPNYNNDYFWIKKSGARGVARGGYWNNQEEAGVYSAYLVVPPTFVGTGVGFRCAK